MTWASAAKSQFDKYQLREAIKENPSFDCKKINLFQVPNSRIRVATSRMFYALCQHRCVHIKLRPIHLNVTLKENREIQNDVTILPVGILYEDDWWQI